MELEEIIGRRLRSARVMRGLSMDELCGRMGGIVSKMAISKYENGRMCPNSTILLAFSDALELSVDYFVKPFSIEIDSVRFLDECSLGRKLEKSIRAEIASMMENHLEVEELAGENVDFTNPCNGLVVKDEDDALISASMLADSWHLGTSGIVNVGNMLAWHGVKVLELDAPAAFEGLSGVVNEKYPFVVLNGNATPEEKRFSALRELGYIIMRFTEDADEKTRKKLCSCFADELLLPTTALRELLGCHRSDISYVELGCLQQQFGVSSDMIMNRARNAGIISPQHYRSYFNRKQHDIAFRELVEKSLYMHEGCTRYRRLVFKALATDAITISKAATLLDESIGDVEKALYLL